MAVSIDLYFGSYTSGRNAGDGITHAKYDPSAGEISVQSHFTEIANPSYLVLSEDGSELAAVGESQGHGWIGRYSRDANGGLALNSKVAVVEGCCHLADLGWGILTASYNRGELCMVPRTGEPTLVTKYQGSGPNRERQEAPHAHQVIYRKSLGKAFVPDLGSDRVWIHRVADQTVEQPTALVTPAGFGPRHLVFSNRSERYYVLGELTGTILECEGDRVLREVPSWDGEPGKAWSAAIKLSPDGKSLAASHRGDHSLAIHPVAEDGSLGAPKKIFCGVNTPRDFSFDPTGQRIVCGGQDAREVSVIHLASGEIQKFAVSGAVCVLFGA